MGTELGGGGTVAIEALAMARRGVRRVLAHLGALPHEPPSEPEPNRRLLELPGAKAYVSAGDRVRSAMRPL